MDAPDRARGGRARSLTSAGAYTFGLSLQRAIGLLMLPVYTRAVTQSEYGALGVLVAVYAGANVIFGLALDTAITRGYFQAADDRQRESQISALWRFLIVWPLAAATVLTLISWPLLSGKIEHVGELEIALTLYSAAVGTAAATVPLTVLRARQALRKYLQLTVLTAFSTPAFTVVFVVVLEEGVAGWFAGALLANLVALAASARVVPWRSTGSLTWSSVRPAVLFSIPLIPHAASHWALQLADRDVLAGLVSEERLGVYTLAANLASPLLMVVIALNQGYMPIYARSGTSENVADELRSTVVTQIAIVVFLTAVCAILSAPAVELLAPDSYGDASNLVPWIVLGYGFLGVYFVPMNGATLGAGRRLFAWVATLAAAATNVALLVIFVPGEGLTAAAVASAAGYLVLLISMSVWAHAGANTVRYDFRRICLTIGSGTLAFLAAVFTAPSALGASVAVRLVWIGVLAVVVTAIVGRRRVDGRSVSA
jgi:O-antigen/teichoic acid export membrane protein